jgi:molybdate/tungstate transport system ATP-binding protein
MIRLSNLVYTAGTFRLEISLEIGEGEYFVVMGPTGAGKTACIECVAGLRAPQSGRIEVGGRDVMHAEPRSRSVGYVPQDYALFMHRTVRRNIAFGPEVHGWSRDEVARAVRDSARLVGIEPLLDRPIPGLSGGERQRVALARALAVRPSLLILDEPVSALDEATRETVCAELRRVQRSLKLTTIHVSHNLEEAFSVADRAAIMRNGRVEQAGPMAELLRRPRNEFVARFMRAENIFHAAARGPDASGTGTVVQTDGVDFVVPGRHEGRVTFMVRPEGVQVVRPGEAPGPAGTGVTEARLVRAVDRGTFVRLELDGSRQLVAHLSAAAFKRMHVAEGMVLSVYVSPEDIHVLVAAGEERERRP